MEMQLNKSLNPFCIHVLTQRYFLLVNRHPCYGMERVLAQVGTKGTILDFVTRNLQDF